MTGAKNFEEALVRLEAIVNKLEEGDLSLEESLALFEEGIKMSRFCYQKLEEAEKKVEIILGEEGGKIKIQSFNLDKEEGSSG